MDTFLSITITSFVLFNIIHVGKKWMLQNRALELKVHKYGTIIFT